MKRLLPLAFLAATAMAGLPAAFAADAPKASESSTASATSMSEGEIRKVDKSAGKITIKHGPIPNLEMPNMTMVFRTTDPAMLDQVKAGDKVRFTADKVKGVYTVTKLEPVK